MSEIKEWRDNLTLLKRFKFHHMKHNIHIAILLFERVKFNLIPIILIIIGFIIYDTELQYKIYNAHFASRIQNKDFIEPVMEICYLHYVMLMSLGLTLLNTIIYILKVSKDQHSFLLPVYAPLIFGGTFAIISSLTYFYTKLFEQIGGNSDTFCQLSNNIVEWLTIYSLLLFIFLTFIDIWDYCRSTCKISKELDCMKRRELCISRESTCFQFWAIDFVVLIGLLFCYLYSRALDDSMVDTSHYYITKQSFNAGITGMSIICSQIIFLCIIIREEYQRMRLAGQSFNF